MYKIHKASETVITASNQCKLNTLQFRRAVSPRTYTRRFGVIAARAAFSVRSAKGTRRSPTERFPVRFSQASSVFPHPIGRATSLDPATLSGFACLRGDSRLPLSAGQTLLHLPPPPDAWRCLDGATRSREGQRNGEWRLRKGSSSGSPSKLCGTPSSSHQTPSPQL